jgi:ADP-dependent NAD(P)H-hydrate dehydratase / NAD(P)H-hydrate epimerase
MQHALTAAAMREADRRTIQEFGLPGFTLMETAGRAAVRVILSATNAERAAVFGILCGKGNNGGDGLVVARVLDSMGFAVRLLMAEGSDGLTEDASLNFSLLARLRDSRIKVVAEANDLKDATVLVDAMLGTGLTSAPRPPYRELVQWMNQQDAFKVALDISTGLHADTGRILGEAVEAHLTVTMGALKTGHLLGDGPSLAGSVVPVQIGIPEFILESQAGEPGCAAVSDDSFVLARLPARRTDANKYTTGPAVVVGGSAKYPGAPSLAARAAARIGSGYVVKALPEDVSSLGDTEILVIRHRMEELGPALDRAKAVLVGPGLGRGAAQTSLVAEVLDRTRCPVVIDADGLRALGELGRLPAERPRILTPHAAEFARLAGDGLDLQDPVRLARHWADRWNVTLILKGMPSVIASPGRGAVICGTGNPALATAGTGDVLAGLCVGLLAMGLTCHDAAVCATHVGGAASDRYVLRRGRTSMMASDLIRQIPLLLSERFDH